MSYIEDLAITLFAANGFDRAGWLTMQEPQGEHIRTQYRKMASAAADMDVELTAAWREAFGLVVCRNRSRDDIEKVGRFWQLMNYRTGLGLHPSDAGFYPPG